MNLHLESPASSFMLHLPQGTWDLFAHNASGASVEEASLHLSWRSGLRRLLWDGKMPGAQVEQQAADLGFPCETQGIKIALVLPDSHLSLRLSFALAMETGLLVWRMSIENLGRKTIRLDQVQMLQAGPIWRRRLRFRGSGSVRPAANPASLRFYCNGWQSWNFAGALSGRERQPGTRLGPFLRPMLGPIHTYAPHGRGVFTSDLYGVLGDVHHGTAILGGFLSQSQAFGGLTARLDAYAPGMRLWQDLEGICLGPGATFNTDWAALGYLNLGDEDPLRPYLDLVASANGVRIKPPPVGWCSWYRYLQGIDSKVIALNLESLKDWRLRAPLEVFQVDDGFAPQVGDWLQPSPRFPDGMIEESRRIKAAGSRPGLWLAPFMARPDSQLIRQHPGWVLRNIIGQPVNAGYTWGRFSRALDPTHPEVLDYIENVVDAAVHTWGYQYLKLDFLYAGALLGFRHDLTKTGAQALRHALERIRKAAGDKVFLAGCGCPLGSGLGVFDAMRIGPDVALGWRPEFHGIEPFFTGETNMPSVRNAIRNIIARAPLHGLWWINDPDCIILQGPSIGKGPSYDGELSAAALPSRLNQIERQSLWTAVALSGGSMMDSDALPELEKADWEQLGRMIPPLPGRPLVPDWFVSSPARLMAMRMESGLGEWMLLAVFNLTDKKQDCSVNMASLWGRAVAGWHSFEAWSGVYAGIGSDGHLNAGYIAPHGVRLYALREHDGRPMWLGDQLHISQGLVVEEWRVDRDVVVARLAPGFPRRGAAWIWLPGELASARISGRPINFHGGPHLYRLDLDLQGPSDLSLALK